MMKHLLAALLYFGTVSYSFGHHDISDDVNFGHLIQFGGTITGVEWAEPHVLIQIVGNPYLPNSPQWLVVLDSPENLKPEGIDIETFEVLTSISVIGYPSKGSFRPGESVIYGLYLARSPSNKILLNEELLRLLENATGIKSISGNAGDVFRFDP